MKKNLSIVFENCTIDNGKILEVMKDDTYVHDINDVFSQLNGEDGITITIKKATKTEGQTEVGGY